MDEPQENRLNRIWPPPPVQVETESKNALYPSTIRDFLKGLAIGCIGWVLLSRLHYLLSVLFWNVHTPGPPFGIERRMLHAYFVRGETLMSLGMLLVTALQSRKTSLAFSRGIYCGTALSIALFMLPTIFVPSRWMYRGL